MVYILHELIRAVHLRKLINPRFQSSNIASVLNRPDAHLADITVDVGLDPGVYRAPVLSVVKKLKAIGGIESYGEISLPLMQLHDLAQLPLTTGLKLVQELDLISDSEPQWWQLSKVSAPKQICIFVTTQINLTRRSQAVFIR